jgi:hypothetical protein
VTVTLAFETAGPGTGAPALVFLGSLGADRSMWDPQFRALSRDFNVALAFQNLAPSSPSISVGTVNRLRRQGLTQSRTSPTMRSTCSTDWSCLSPILLDNPSAVRWRNGLRCTRRGGCTRSRCCVGQPSSANHKAGSTGLLACEPKEPRR